MINTVPPFDWVQIYCSIRISISSTVNTITESTAAVNQNYADFQNHFRLPFFLARQQLRWCGNPVKGITGFTVSVSQFFSHMPGNHKVVKIEYSCPELKGSVSAGCLFRDAMADKPICNVETAHACEPSGFILLKINPLSVLQGSIQNQVPGRHKATKALMKAFMATSEKTGMKTLL